jgi:hypothetical protein
MKERTVSAFLKEMMLRGLRLLVWLWLGSYGSPISAAGTIETRATFRDPVHKKERIANGEQNVYIAHSLSEEAPKLGRSAPGIMLNRRLPASPGL